MAQHYHYVLQGYQTMLSDGRLQDVTQVDVFARTEEEAVLKASQLVTKPIWRVSNVIEHQPDMEEARCPSRPESSSSGLTPLPVSRLGGHEFHHSMTATPKVPLPLPTRT